MCIAIPVRIVAILDAEKSIVLVEGGDGREEVCAALVADAAGNGTELLDHWAVVHSGFVLSLMDADEAASRLAVFAAMDGLPVADADLHPALEETTPPIT
ncbi:HypC/HybG/HupF family hydrogenase formation chaperone [Telmatospirillum sp.]|uniref:HypC/HybG/HupF family hydrogenase formation chaperone n=1 Tax=Telmatospirillum sp. TaxID=2079197 RepID=UPI0028489C2D|nr:HypC/HybG/HupF family hydrogenase formation chaperone [Telmatospirillum sp.]MDR3438341.1 HypC/HybG/HupF family hydrogenase formation chaperone [Telmatospirillum sp.]